MKLLEFVFVSVLCAALAACISTPPGQSSYNYTPPKKMIFDNNIIVNHPFEEVWDDMVKSLSMSFFVINNIDKSSRLINLSFSTDKPAPYVDCGIMHRHFSYNGDVHEYEYPFSASASYKKTDLWYHDKLTSVYDMNHKTDMSGRINVYISPLADAKTKVSVNIKYILDVKLTGDKTMYDRLGDAIPRGEVPEQSMVIDFTTNEGVSGLGGVNAQCYSTGVLEGKILDFVR